MSPKMEPLRYLSHSLFPTIFVFASVGLLPIHSRPLPLLVDTTYGSVRGVRETTHDAFLGIPFARPPVGDLRWRDPQPPQEWTPDILKADSQPPGCMQTCVDQPFACPTTTSEDCLYMNIYRPSATESEGLLPVFVYFHGGNFEVGACSAVLYDGRILASASDALVVCINYRLGAFGFLYLGEDKTTGEQFQGNYGLQDQIAGLKFLKDNVERFGGDPNKITIAGQSAGAQSVAMHMTSPTARDLFDQAIMFSEPFGLPLKTPPDAFKLGEHFAAILTCQNDTVTCLRSKTADEIKAASKASESFEVNPMKFFQQFQTWGPVVNVQPIELFENGLYHRDKAVMMGSVAEEGRIFVFGLIEDPVSNFFYAIFLSLLVPENSDEILKHYPADPNLEDQREVISQLASDYVFTCPTYHAANIMYLRDNSNVYHYIFDQAFSDQDAWGYHVECYGHVCHGGDLPFIFGTATLAGYSYTEEETALVNSEMKYIANFLHTGNPNEGTEDATFGGSLTHWPSMRERQKSWSSLYLSGDKSISVLQNQKEDICSFWDDIGYYGVPKINK